MHNANFDIINCYSTFEEYLRTFSFRVLLIVFVNAWLRCRKETESIDIHIGYAYSLHTVSLHACICDRNANAFHPPTILVCLRVSLL